MAAPRKRQRQPANYAEDDETYTGADSDTCSEQDGGTSSADASDDELTAAEKAAIKAGQAAAPARAGAVARRYLRRGEG